MIYLNHELLTSTGIITYFEKNVLNKNINPREPWPITRLKNKLKTIFFTDLATEISDNDLLNVLESDERFRVSYPKLKGILHAIFTLPDAHISTPLEVEDSPDWSRETVAKNFDHVNEKYGYFVDSSEPLRMLFIELCISVRAMIMLVEKNNGLTDIMVYEYAYKLIVLFLDPKKPTQTPLDDIARAVYKLMKSGDKDDLFYYNLLSKLESLPKACHLADLAGWRQLIKNHGIRSLVYLMNGQEIEEKNSEQLAGRGLCSPESLMDAKKIAMLCRYKRANEDFDFATICDEYNVSADRFNKCLDYMKSGWPKKTTESILYRMNIKTPVTSKKGSLHWVKLPIADKRALILGDITRCSQSIGGASEQCVKYAVSSSDTSLFVLMEQYKAGCFELVEKEAINDRDFKIIGESCVWTSLDGNLCLDSIELLDREEKQDNIKNATIVFTQQLLHDNPDVNYITVGRGIKKPIGLFDDAVVPETSPHSGLYDSESQYYIAKREPKLEGVYELLEHDVQPFRGYMLYLCEHMPNTPTLASDLKVILEKYPALREQLSLPKVKELMQFSQPLTLSDLEPVDFEALQKLSPEEASVYPPISLARLIFWMKSTPLNPNIRLQSDGIKSASYLGNVLKYLTPEQCTVLCESMGENFSVIIQSIQDYMLVQHPLNTEQRKALFEWMKAIFPNIIQSASDLVKTMQLLNLEQRRALFKSIMPKLHEISMSIDNFLLVLPLVSAEQITFVFERMKANSFSDLIKTPSHVGRVLQYLTIDECTVLCESIKDSLPNIIKSYDDFMLSFRPLNAQKRTIVFDVMKRHLSQIIKSGDDLDLASKYLSAEQYAILKSIKANLADVLPDGIDQTRQVLRLIEPIGFFNRNRTSSSPEDPDVARYDLNATPMEQQKTNITIQTSSPF